MISKVTVFHKGGAVLWTSDETKKNETPVATTTTKTDEIEKDNINELIQGVLLSDQSNKDSLINESYTIKWTFANELDLVFVAIYFSFQKLLKVDNFLQMCKREFLKMFSDQLKKGITILINEDYNKFNAQYIRITKYFFKNYKNQNLTPKSFKDTSQGKKHNLFNPNNSSKKGDTPKDDDGDDDDEDDNNTFGFGRKKRGPKEYQGNKKKGKNKSKKNKKGKDIKKREWDIGTTLGRNKVTNKKEMDSFAITKDILDDENSDNDNEGKYDEPIGEMNLDDSDISDQDDDDFADLLEGNNDDNSNNKKSSGFLWSSFNKLIGNNELTENDLEKPLQLLEEQLTTKNVANIIAHDLCESVKKTLIGKKIGTFVSIKSFVKQSMTNALERILTQKDDINILYGIQNAKNENRPYTIVFIGVNGVGKSTSLAKVINYFQTRNIKVSVAACDTFRSGAVEQLRTHCKKFNVRLYQQGYARDAGAVAINAVKVAKTKGDNVVLIDTAGRMQNNEPLMRSLVSLIERNNPDLVLFVGEALVGNDGINQISEFNNSLKKYASHKNPRLIDGIILTKFDTVDDKVGAAISMTYQSKKPIVFVGTGQGYSDLKRMHPRTLINKLLT